MQDLKASLDACIKCNICTTHCPVAAVTDKFPGPKYAGPQAERYRAAGRQPVPDASVDYCSGCRVCNEVCPSGVKIAELNGRARAEMVSQQGLSLRNRLLGRSELLGKLGSIAPRVANFVLHNPFSRYAAQKTVGIAQEAPLPKWSEQGTFADWLQKTAAVRLRSDKKVVYFHGCATMYYEPFVGQAAVLVLEHLGYELIVPPQNCCGLPMLSNGEFKAGAAYYQRNIAHLQSYVAAGIPIVGTSTSCTLTLKEEAPELLGIETPASQALTMAVWDLFEWLRERHEAGELPNHFQPLEMKLPYHMPCQYRAHRVGRPAAELLRLIPGLNVQESAARCCGIAGTYGLKQEKYEIGMAVGAELFDFVEKQDAELTACDSETCRWQLEHGTALPSRHPIEILAAAYGLYHLIERRPLLENTA